CRSFEIVAAPWLIEFALVALSFGNAACICTQVQSWLPIQLPWKQTATNTLADHKSGICPGTNGEALFSFFPPPLSALAPRIASRLHLQSHIVSPSRDDIPQVKHPPPSAEKSWQIQPQTIIGDEVPTTFCGIVAPN